MRILSMSFLLGSLLNLVACAGAQTPNPGFQTRTLTLENESYTYKIYVPAKLQGQRNVPVLTLLHGIGQRGTGGFVPTAGATATLAKQYLEQVPAVILFPQCRPGRFWHQPDMERMVLAQLEQTVAEFGADRQRLYLGGVSMGGFGLWHLAAQHPGKFAALISVCGGSPILTGDRFTRLAQKVGQTPAWVFHGSADRVVPVSESRQLVEALKRVPGNRVRYSEYEGVGHNVWLQVMKESELLPWLFAQRLG
jgi:predicted peptidase